jgi:GT2 family glycosyltransferase
VSILFRDYELLAKSGLFDAAYYLRANPHLSELNIDPLTHYLEVGCREKRDPSAGFDTSHYLSQCEAYGETPENPLLHFLTVGIARGLTPKLSARGSPSTPGRLSALKPSSKRTAKTATKRPETPTAAESKQVIDGAKAAEPIATFDGYVDVFGYCTAAGGWFFNGWVSRPSNTDQPEAVTFLAQFERSQINGAATLAFYHREDLDQKSIGMIAFVPGGSRILGAFQHIAFMLDGRAYRAQVGPGTTRLLDQALVERVRLNLINQAFANQSRDYLLSLSSRRGYAGQDTLGSLSETVLLEIDDAIVCPPSGVLIKGWTLSAPGVIRSIRVRSGPLAGELALSDAIRISRPDVIAAVGPQYGFSDARCGFTVYVPSAVSTGDPTYIEVELENGEVGFRTLKLSKRSGLDAIRRILDGIDVRYAELDSAFDKVLGPAVRAINVTRLQEPLDATEVVFGEIPSDPKASLIIPLYGRVDFVEYQMALFSRHRDVRKTEIIYVLDDPGMRRELEILAHSTFERFRIPFRLLLLPQNRGFAPANNLGLRAARGKYVCFLNSDILPVTDNWLERLIARLEQNADIGVIGARLLFEDGSIQHEGCFYRTIHELGDWTFIDHVNKGRRPSLNGGIHRCVAITGACMVMQRSLAAEIGGFDESYVVGDFEDSDLCRRLRARGLSAAVDNDVTMHHLERKSQVAPNHHWRMNLTLYNAWVHQRRWFRRPNSNQTQISRPA